ncbi:MAG: hypothetical protein HQ495_06545 [Alphaproteobacteria bacterium]|nr:hypothetical protein [Alphaproteobacteria bacterium]
MENLSRLFMIYLVFTVTVAVFGEPFMGATTGASNSAVPGSPLEFVVISTALSVLVALFVGVASAVSYFYLRMYKEGVEIGEIATVFD